MEILGKKGFYCSIFYLRNKWGRPLQWTHSIFRQTECEGTNLWAIWYQRDFVNIVLLDQYAHPPVLAKLIGQKWDPVEVKVPFGPTFAAGWKIRCVPYAPDLPILKWGFSWAFLSLQRSHAPVWHRLLLFSAWPKMVKSICRLRSLHQPSWGSRFQFRAYIEKPLGQIQLILKEHDLGYLIPWVWLSPQCLAQAQLSGWLQEAVQTAVLC